MAPRDPRIAAAELRIRLAREELLRKAIGPPLDLPDAALEQASVMGALEAAVGGSWWDRVSGMPGLVDARVDDVLSGAPADLP